MRKEKTFEKIVQLLDAKCLPFSHVDPSSYKAILDQIGDARFVLIGEATHGTQEFYTARAELSKQLIAQKGFMAVAIEGDWPDAYQVNRYLKGIGNKDEPTQALQHFSRFPTWMWRNTTLPPFLTWLRTYNDAISIDKQKIGFYGLDLYSLHQSMQAVIEYLKNQDPDAAKRAQERYACFDHLSIDPESYGYLINQGLKASCVKKAIAQLQDLQNHGLEYIKKDGFFAEEEYFYATQNARLVKNAEAYYRAHFEGRVSSWNIRDQHMAETLNILANHLENCFNRPAKIIIWAHNSHVGDARATEMAEQQEINLGQLVREQHDRDAFLIGFSTYQGYVTASHKWGGPTQRKAIVPGMRGSYEELFHHLKHKEGLLPLAGDQELAHYLNIPRLQRAIGVIYRADTERYSHYFFTRLPEQFDLLIHIDQTEAVKPLNVNGDWKH